MAVFDFHVRSVLLMLIRNQNQRATVCFPWTYGQHVKLLMNMDSAISSNTFCYYLECFQFWFCCHTYGTERLRTTQIHETVNDYWKKTKAYFLMNKYLLKRNTVKENFKKPL